MTKPTKWLCAQGRLRSAWVSAQSDQSSLCAQWVAKDPGFLNADSEDSDQTGRMPRLIWVFSGRTCHFAGFVMRRLISFVIKVRSVTSAAVTQEGMMVQMNKWTTFQPLLKMMQFFIRIWVYSPNFYLKFCIFFCLKLPIYQIICIPFFFFPSLVRAYINSQIKVCNRHFYQQRKYSIKNSTFRNTYGANMLFVVANCL